MVQRAERRLGTQLLFVQIQLRHPTLGDLEPNTILRIQPALQDEEDVTRKASWSRVKGNHCAQKCPVMAVPGIHTVPFLSCDLISNLASPSDHPGEGRGGISIHA